MTNFLLGKIELLSSWPLSSYTTFANIAVAVAVAFDIVIVVTAVVVL